ncbi:hypothetical protein FRIG_07760 [Frigoribacterium faeni]|uniref:hypothetical protein n=1 Tax=Frigoribacterium faeni TaxID=145483 RepID=UPI001FAC00EC|nr:hypothetical protein [Frigoribacterium faeni]MCJ0701027.1 hypothetical protein [Frigoribacterium faeni]
MTIQSEAGPRATALDAAPLGVIERIVTTVDTSRSSVVDTTTHSRTKTDHTAVLVVPIEAK